MLASVYFEYPQRVFEQHLNRESLIAVRCKRVLNNHSCIDIAAHR